MKKADNQAQVNLTEETIGHNARKSASTSTPQNPNK